MRLLESERAVISTEEFSYSCGIGKKERKREIFIFIVLFFYCPADFPLI